MTRVVIDPITRIEGHLRIEVEVQNGQVTDAWSSATLYRGVENMLQGRDPLDAPIITQRLCGVCTYVHMQCSVEALENAYKITIPANARLIRNLLTGAQYLHDHIVHFYQLHGLDWSDIVSALSASPTAAAALAKSISPSAKTFDFAAVKTRLQTFVGSGQLGPFANAYWGHKQYRLPPEANLVIAAHYIEALQQQTRTAKMMAIFGGKNPHPQSVVVGGVTCLGDLTTTRTASFRSILNETKQFIDTIYLPDLKLVAQYYKTDWAAIGGTTNFLAYGEFPSAPSPTSTKLFPAGVIMSRNLKSASTFNQASVLEHVTHSWYDGDLSLHPSDGETSPLYTSMNTAGKYSWCKAPRYGAQPMEVGPLARVLVGYARKQSVFVNKVNALLSQLGVQSSALFSTLGRTAARAIETQIIAEAMPGWLTTLENNIKSNNKAIFTSYTKPTNAMGMAFGEAPRGALGHWVDIANGKIANYQLVVPSAWNLGPRCEGNKRSPVESALIGTPVADPAKPLEVLRTVHSFDPCMACAVHVIDPERKETFEVRAV